MGFIFSKFSILGSGAKPPSPNPSPSVAEVNQLFEPTHSFWAGYATAYLTILQKTDDTIDPQQMTPQLITHI